MSKHHIGKICPCCQIPFKADSEVVQCLLCKVPHHCECLTENGGCTTFGCHENSCRSAAGERLEVTLDETSEWEATPARGGLVNKFLITALVLSLLVIIGLMVGPMNLHKNGQSYQTKGAASNEITLMANEIGNTTGNLSNRGMAAQQGDWIYYRSNDNGNIYKINVDGSNRSKVNNDDSWYINVVGEWIYYTNAADDSRIYKIQTNGSGRKKISEDRADFLLVAGDWIYYISGYFPYQIYKLRTDGSASEMLLSDVSWKGGVVVSENWIYYTNGEREICRINTDGSGFEIIDNAHWASDLVVVGEWIYHIWSYDAGIKIYKVRIDGTDYNRVTSSEAIYFNADQDWIYFSNLEDDHYIYRTDADGKEEVRINEDRSSNINLVDDWIYYTNADNEDKIYKIRTDGSERQLVN